jgi:hypothetical protein
MKYILFLLLAFSIFPSTVKSNTNNCVTEGRFIGYGEAVKCLEEAKNENNNLKIEIEKIKKSSESLNKIVSDNITIETMNKTQELHNIAFDKMQKSFSNFLTAVIVINSVLAIFVGFLVWINFRSVSNSKNDLKNLEKGFKSNLTALKTELEEQIKNQKIKFTDLEQEQEQGRKQKKNWLRMGFAVSLAIVCLTTSFIMLHKFLSDSFLVAFRTLDPTNRITFVIAIYSVAICFCILVEKEIDKIIKIKKTVNRLTLSELKIVNDYFFLPGKKAVKLDGIDEISAEVCSLEAADIIYKSIRQTGGGEDVKYLYSINPTYEKNLSERIKKTPVAS